MNAKVIKALQDLRLPDALPARRVHTQSTMLYLMQLRSLVSHIVPSQIKISLSVRFKDGNAIHAKPVKITHI